MVFVNFHSFLGYGAGAVNLGFISVHLLSLAFSVVACNHQTVSRHINIL